MAIPQRDVDAPDGSTWHITLRRGWWKRGPRWWRRFSSLCGNLIDHDGLVGAVMLAVYLPTLAPFALYRVLAYIAKRRSDWVVVGEKHGARWDAPIICERYATKERAAARAEEIVRVIKAGPSD